MTDFAKLQIDVAYGTVEKAGRALDEAAASAGRAEREVGRIGPASQAAGAAAVQAGRTTAQAMAQAESGVQRFMAAVQRLDQRLKALHDSIKTVRSVVSAAATTTAQFVGSILDAGKAVERMRTMLTVATGSAAEASRELELVRRTAKTLGQDFLTSGQAFAKLSASARSLGLTAQDVRDIFTGVSGAATAMGLSSGEAQGAFTALQQILAKGRVQIDALRGQLGDLIPTAVADMAEALGFGADRLGDFEKALADGTVGARQAVTALAALWNDKFTRGIADAQKSTNRQIIDFGNAIDGLRVKVADSGFLEGFGRALEDIGTLLGHPAFTGLAGLVGEGFGLAFRAAGEAALLLNDNLGLVGVALTALATRHITAAIRLTASFTATQAAAAAAVLSSARATGILTVALNGFNRAATILARNPIGLALNGIALAFALVGTESASAEQGTQAVNARLERTIALEKELQFASRGRAEQIRETQAAEIAAARAELLQLERRRDEIETLLDELREKKIRQGRFLGPLDQYEISKLRPELEKLTPRIEQAGDQLNDLVRATQTWIDRGKRAGDTATDTGDSLEKLAREANKLVAEYLPAEVATARLKEEEELLGRATRDLADSQGLFARALGIVQQKLREAKDGFEALRTAADTARGDLSTERLLLQRQVDAYEKAGAAGLKAERQRQEALRLTAQELGKSVGATDALVSSSKRLEDASDTAFQAKEAFARLNLAVGERTKLQERLARADRSLTASTGGSAKATNEFAEAIKGLNLEIVNARGRLGTLALPEGERAAEVRFIQTVNDLRSRGVKLGEDDLGLLHNRIALLDDVNDRIDDATAAQERAAAAERERQQQVESVTSGLVGEVSTAFKGMWDDAGKGFDQLLDRLGDRFTGWLADLVAEAAIRPIVLPIVQGFFGGSVGGAAAPFGSFAGAAGLGAPAQAGALGQLANVPIPPASLFGGSGGLGGLGAIGRGINSLLDTQIITTAAANPAAFGGPSSGLLTFDTGAGLSGITGSGLTVGGLLGGAGVGLFSGQIANLLFGGNSLGASIGGGIGGAGGAALAALPALAGIPGIGILAPVLGGLLGGGLGGLFGKRPSVGPNAASLISGESGTLRIAGLGADNGGDEALPGIRDASERIIQAVEGVLGATGARLSTGANIGVANFEKKGGFLSRVGDDERAFGSDIDAALRDLLGRTLTTYALDLPDDVRTAIERSGAETADALLEDIDFARAFDDAVALMKGGVIDFADAIRTQATAELDDTTRRIVQFKDKAAELGLSTTDAADATRSYVEILLGIKEAQEPLSVTAQAWERLNTIAASMGPLLDEVGIDAAKAAAGIDALRNRIRVGFNQALQDEIDQAQGLGAVPQLRALIDERDQRLADARTIGGSVELVDKSFEARARALLDGLDLGILKSLQGRFAAGANARSDNPLFSLFADLIGRAQQAADEADAAAAADQAAADAAAEAAEEDRRRTAAIQAATAATREQLSVVEEQIRQVEQSIEANRRLADQIRETRLNLDLTPETSTLGAEERLLRLRTEITELRRQALGDGPEAADAASRITQLAATFQQASRAVFATSTPFGQDSTFIKGVLSEIEDRARSEIDVAEDQLSELRKQSDALAALLEKLQPSAGALPDKNYGANAATNRAIEAALIAAGLPTPSAYGGGQLNALKASNPDVAYFLDHIFTFARGGVMGPRGSIPLRAYAGGGIADGPQLALYGEGSMPEAFVPLPDRRSIPVTIRSMPASDDVIGGLAALRRELAAWRRQSAQETRALRDELRQLRHEMATQGALAERRRAA